MKPMKMPVPPLGNLWDGSKSQALDATAPLRAQLLPWHRNPSVLA